MGRLFVARIYRLPGVVGREDLGGGKERQASSGPGALVAGVEVNLATS